MSASERMANPRMSGSRAGAGWRKADDARSPPLSQLGTGFAPPSTSGQQMDPRTAWIARRMKDAVGEAARERVNVDSFVKSAAVAKRLEEFYAAAGPSRILFFFQQGATAIPTFGDEEPETKLLLTDGLDTQLRGKCIYFMRRTYGVDVDVKKPDIDMSYGEVSSDILESFHLTLHGAFLPLLQGGMQDWGKNTDAGTKEYLSHVTRFDEMLADAVSSLQGGIELHKPEKRFIIENKQQAYQRAAQDPDILAVYEQVMEDWCEQCEQLLAESTVTDEIEDESGPDTEFEFWRNRMAKFNSVAEQLKTRDCKCVLGVVGQNPARSKCFRRWKHIDSLITDSLNEARDNVKYLSALERYTEALYSGTPAGIIDALPALIHNMKVMLTISRFYGTNDRMTTLFSKITNQIIVKCKESINMKAAGVGNEGVRLWDQEIPSLLDRFRVVLKVQDVYWSFYSGVKEKLAHNPKGKQFEFNESLIFGKLEMFCKRVQKLLDMFTTIHQFSSLALHNVEGMEILIQRFFDIMIDFKRKPYDMLDFTKNAFDRDYLEYTVKIADLEQQVQTFINLSFENILSTEQALSLLKQFEMVLVRDSLKSDLDSKYTVIFHNYGLDLESVQRLYEKQKGSPPLLRNAPPVTGNILWAKQLLRRIEDPMRRFKSHSSLMSNSKEAKKIVRTYNKVARALVEFETLWHSAWTKSIEAARSGLQATLIIRHPVTANLFVNFDREILQLIREAKCLQRARVEVPDSARLVLVHEDKYKSYYNQLTFALQEYERIVGMVVPLMQPLLESHLKDLGHKIQPGMVLLTWQSMNIDGYLQHVHVGLSKFEKLMKKVNDILDHRIEGNLRMISKTLLVELPSNDSFTLEQFVTLQEKTTKLKTLLIESKNEEIENAVNDVIYAVTVYPLEIAENVSKEAIQKFWDHYARLIYVSVMRCTKESFFALKKRLASKASGGFLYMERPFFDVDIELSLPLVTMNPSLDEIQAAINRCALNILRCSKNILQWPRQPSKQGSDRGLRDPFHHVIAQDYQIVAVCLMLTGAVEGIKKQVHDYLQTFMRYDFLWKEDKQLAYDNFVRTPRNIDDYEAEIQRYVEMENSIAKISPVHNIGSLSLETGILKSSLRQEVNMWKRLYTGKIHDQARSQLGEFLEFMKECEKKLDLECNSIDDAKSIMGILGQIRDKEMDMEIQIRPIHHKYFILLKYDHILEREELESINLLQASWNQVVKKARQVSDNLYLRQNTFREELLADVANFVEDVAQFRDDFIRNGPMEEGASPEEAAARMRKYKHLYMERERKWRKYADGEALFGMPKTMYMEMDVTRKELELLDKLYSLYTNVMKTIGEYRVRPWIEATVEMENMTEQVNLFQERAKKMPKQLRSWEAYHDLTKDVGDFIAVLPLIQALSSHAMRPRHWTIIQKMSAVAFDNESPNLTVGGILETGLHKELDAVEAIRVSAERELEVEKRLSELQEVWSDTRFEFLGFKNKGPVLLKGKELALILDKVEDSTNVIGTMVGHSHSEPFRDDVQNWIRKLTSVQEVLEQWMEVQSMWVYMEAVFSNSDIAKQLPQEKKRFDGIDKSYMKLMHKAFEISNVVQCCHGHEPMRTVLPNLAGQLELCQKSLNGYFESKRLIFPRFFFISDALLLELLSDGTEPQKVMAHIGTLFDSLVQVSFDEVEPLNIILMTADGGEQVKLLTGLKCEGMAEEYLEKLVSAMRLTIQDLSRECANEVFVSEEGLMVSELFQGFPGQVCLVGLQIYWTWHAEDAISKTRHDKLVMNNTAKRFDADLKELIALIQNDLKPPQRVSLASMITQHMHHKEAFDELVKAKIKDIFDFEWQKQLRADWKSDEDQCVIQMMDIRMIYQNEYLGCKERLVVTPLTSRCYITIFQTLSMHLGVAAFGSSAAGKTMVIKDIGRTLGQYVVVVNCSSHLGVSGLSKILKGVAMAGCWGCMDHFSRIDPNDISVVAQQMSTILFAKRANAKSFVLTDGDNGSLVSTAAFLMTLLPSEEKLLDLPENMKTQLRGIMMISTDPRTILRVKLTAAGYTESQHLSKKVSTLYDMCQQCLSKQLHYDFGLRNLSSFVSSCESLKRSITEADMSESEMVVRILNENNLPSLTQEDSILFLDLVSTLFPGLSGKKLEDIRRSDIFRAICEAKFLEYDAIPAIRWKEKLENFYDTCLVRRGLCLVGPTGSGKSAILQTCLQTLESLTGTTQWVKMMNPKAVDLVKIFGHHDQVKSKWREGIFSTLWRKAAKNSSSDNWLVFDGPVDSDWMEDLNTVLDDTGVLALANGDRLPFPKNLRILLETDHLENSSPAMASRLGIICMGPSTVGHEIMVSSWMKSRPDAQRALLLDIFDRSFPEIIAMAARVIKPVLDVSTAILVQNTLRLLQIELSRGRGSDNANHTAPQLERLVFYSVCWSFGALVEPDGRARFEAELKKILTKGSPPHEAGKAFECYIDGKGDWLAATNLDVTWEFPIGADYFDIYVPTSHNAQYRQLMEMVITHKIPILLVGAAGVSKTATILEVMRDRAAKAGLTSKRTSLSADTSPAELQRAIESATEKRQGRIYGPSNYRTCSVFIDDVNVPRLSKWGDQPTSELLRQLLTDNGFFSLDKPGEWKFMKDLEYFAAMTHPGGGRNDIPARLKRRMMLLNMTAPPTAAVSSIFSAIVRGYFSEKNVEKDVAKVALLITDPTVHMWKDLQEKITPTITKFHYTYSLRDLSSVFRGMLRCHSDLFEGKEYIARLWKHECMRAFTDKLTSPSDQAVVVDVVNRAVDDALGKLATKTKGALFFCTFMQNEEDLLLADGERDPDALFQPYELCQSFEDIELKVQNLLKKFNGGQGQSQKLDLVLFAYAIEHLLKIIRALCFDGGSCMLIGLKACGKQSMATLAMYILEQRVLRIPHVHTYSRAELLEDLKGHCRHAALNDRHFTLFLDDSDLLEECFLDLVNQLIFTGEVTDMFSKDEISSIVTEASFRSEVQKHMPEWSESTEALAKFFVRRVRRNFHCILSFSPTDDKFMVRMRSYPALMSCCHLIWFSAWPVDSLHQVAEHYFSKHKIKMQHKDEILQHLPEVQDMAQATALEYTKESGEPMHVTSTTYLLYLETYAHVFHKKEAELQLAIKKFKRGLRKLDQVGEEIKEMIVDIEDSEKFLIKAQSDSADLLKQITSQQSILERKKKTLDEAVAKSAALEDVVSAEQVALAKELTVADPYVKNARDALQSIGPKEQQVLKVMKSPPMPVKVVLDCTLIVMHKPLNAIKVTEEKGVQHYRDSYASAYLMMQDGTLMDALINFSEDHLNEETIELLQPYLENALFSFEGARKTSAMAASLLTWLKALDDYYGVAGALNPRKRKLGIKESDLASQKRSLAISEEDLNKTKGEMEEMQANLREAVNAKADIQNETELTKEKVKFANKLIRALTGEKTRWMACAGDFQLRLAALPGNASVAASFLSYGGLMALDFRSQLCRSVISDLNQKGIPKYDVTLVDLLSTSSDRSKWTSQGLATDELSVENGILVSQSLQWPLLIDPEGQGLEWILAREKENVLKSTSISDHHFVQVFEECVSHGRPLLIENVKDRLHPILQTVLDKRLALDARVDMSIRIEGRDVACCQGFALYLITKLPHPCFGPEISNCTNVISFKVSMESLQDQLFAHIVEKERPEFQSQKVFTVREVSSLQQQKADIESDILTKLYGTSETGSILDDITLLDVLDKVKEIDRMVKEKEKIIDGIGQKIDQSCSEMRAVSRRGSALYSVMLDMSKVNPMYRTSLQQFKRIFQKSLTNAAKENAVHVRVQNMKLELTWTFFSTVRRGVFERHKGLFALLICIKIVLFDGQISEEQFRCLVEGGEGLNSDDVRPKPYNWFPSDSWLNVISLVEMFPVLKDLPDSVQHLGDQWRSWYDSATPEAVKFPEIPSAFDKITPFLHLAIVRAIRPDRFMVAARRFVKETLGDDYNVAPESDLEDIFEDSSPQTPLIFLLSSGADPTGLIIALGRKLKREILSVSMGQGQTGLARRNFETGIQIGSWVLLQNVHLDLKFLHELELALHKVESVEDEFRLFMTTQVALAFPVGLLQMSMKVTNESPTGVKSGLRRLYSLINQDMLEAVPRFEWRSLLFSLAFMHSVMSARRSFGQCGWSSPSEYSHADFICGATFLQSQFKELETKKRKEVHWETLRNMIVQNMYGGNRSDKNDLRIMRTLSEKYLSPLVLETNFQFSLGYPMPSGTDLASFRASIEAYPDNEKLEVMGMSATTEFVYGLRHSQEVLANFAKTIATPGADGPPQRVPESALLHRIDDLLQKFPHPFAAADVRESLEKDGGVKLPTNLVFQHEINAFDAVVKMARHTLQKAHIMLSGNLTPSEHLREVVNDIYFHKVPKIWVKCSWPAQNFGHWMVQLQHRLEQLKRWLERGRPFSFWLAGFSNPAGFLAALKQEVAAKQKGWGLENCTFFTEVTKLDASDLKGPAENGAYVHGLCLEGAAWNRKEGKIVDSLSKVPHTQLPVVYICVLLKSAKKYDFQVYECPCYSHWRRGCDRLVFTADLKTEELPSRWILRGVALLCTKD